MTEEEKKTIAEQYKNGIVYVSSIIEPLIEQFKVDKGSIDIQQLQLVCDYLIKDRDYLEIYIDDLDTEINKLNNVIDRMAEVFSKISKGEYVTIESHTKKDKIKEYFMKE